MFLCVSCQFICLQQTAALATYGLLTFVTFHLVCIYLLLNELVCFYLVYITVYLQLNACFSQSLSSLGVQLVFFFLVSSCFLADPLNWVCLWVYFYAIYQFFSSLLPSLLHSKIFKFFNFEISTCAFCSWTKIILLSPHIWCETYKSNKFLWSYDRGSEPWVAGWVYGCGFGWDLWVGGGGRRLKCRTTGWNRLRKTPKL